MRTAASSGIARAVEVLFEPGAAVELRALKGRETVSGYFDDHEALADEARGLDERGYAVYVVLNEIDPALLARAANRVERYPKVTTSDHDVVRRRWLPVDLDPVRPSGVSATDEEKRAAKVRAREVYDYLKARGWPEPVVGDSGNGYHLLYPVDLPNDTESLKLVRGVLEGLSFQFSDERVSVDTTTSNAARIWKMYGTTARKGDSTEDRPHRVSKLLKIPEGLEATAPREKLKAVAAMRPPPPPRDFDPGRNGRQEFDLEAWIAERGVPVRREGPWQRGGYRWVLEECPFQGHRDNSAYIVRSESGAIAAGCHHDSCQGYGWRDLRKHYEPGAYEKNGRPRSGDEAPSGAWAEPVPLPDSLPPVAPFDPALLPEPLAPWVRDIAERMQVPADYVAVGAITVAASLVGRKVGIRPKRHDDWTVVPNLWGAVVGNPATLKSPALAEAMRPLDRLVASAREVYQAAVEDHEVEAATVEAMKAGLKEQIKKAAKADDEAAVKDLVARLKGMEVPDEPRPRRYKTEDPTTEKLAELLIENPRGLLVHRDELSGWLRSLDRQGREADRAFYLESWNGTGSFEIDRIGRGSQHVPALCVSILGGIQPGPLRSYVYEAARGGEGADGLLQRFQALVWPDPPRSWRNVDRYPNTEAKNRAYAVYEALDGLNPEELGATPVHDGDIPYLRFSPDSQKVFDRWRDELETKLRGDELPPVLGSHLAKYRSLMPTLALVFHLIAVVDEPAEAGPVGVEAAERAAAWCEYLETHAKRLYASGGTPAMEGARALLRHIRKGDVRDGSTVREVYRGREWSKLATPEEINAAAAMLEDYGWLRVERVETGGRPTTRLRLHPVLLEGTGA